MESDPESTSDAVQLHLDGFEGPLDLLLDLARRQQVDLARISIVTLVDQFVAAVTTMPRADIARRAEWLVMAAWLTWLKSRLLLPKDLEEAQQGAEAGNVLIDRLTELERIRSVVAWLDANPQLGRDMFERGHGLAPAGPVVVADLSGLFEACLAVLQRPDPRSAAVYVPARTALWTPAQARARILAMLPGLPEGADLLAFLPVLPVTLANRALRVRGAISGTLMAALELSREGLAELRQDELFGPIGMLAGSATEHG